jgi:acyl carrier protein
MDIKEQIIKIISEVLKLDEQEITNLRLEVGYKSLKKWTSSRHAEIIVALEDHFGEEVDELSIPKLNTVAKIADYFKRTKH